MIPRDCFSLRARATATFVQSEIVFQRGSASASGTGIASWTMFNSAYKLRYFTVALNSTIGKESVVWEMLLLRLSA